MSPHIVTADFVYLRLYGPQEKFRSSYNDEQLGVLAVHCREWQSNGKDVYLYFVNDHLGYAPRNAQRLLELIQPTA
jgi:uncharacterized protein YecE (DUF72 family)